VENSEVVLLEEGEDDTRPLWAEAFGLWLETLAENTRLAYTCAWKSFLGYTGKQPWEMGKTDVARWVDELRRRRLAVTTINQRTAAISSFYQYARDEYEVVTPDGRYTSLHEHNPAAAPSLRGTVNPYGKASSLNSSEARALLSAIPRDTIRGRRDFALILTYLATGRRNSEVRLLKWGAFEEREERVWYRWSGKGRTDMRFELVPPAWKAIKMYLKSAGRLQSIQEDDYVFTAMDGVQPLSIDTVRKTVKRYARLAGMDPGKVKVHTLRHTAAMLRKEVGDPVEAISQFLAHSSLAVTQIYLHQVEGQRDTSWSRVEALLGL